MKNITQHTTPPQNYLSETISLKQSLERNFLELGGRLKRIRDEEIYRGRYDSFKEFLEDMKLTESFASRLITIHSRFIGAFHMKQEELAEVGWSSLYQIAKYTDEESEARELVEKAKTWRRADLEDELRERKTKCVDHDFEDKRIILRKCRVCSKLVREYEEN